jgi:hypothetical protein
MILKPPSKLRTGGSHLERHLGVSYNLAFKILGPTPRVQRKEEKRKGVVKYPDEAVRRCRMLGLCHTPGQIAAELSKKYPGISAEWVARVLDGTIRGNVK